MSRDREGRIPYNPEDASRCHAHVVGGLDRLQLLPLVNEAEPTVAFAAIVRNGGNLLPSILLVRHAQRSKKMKLLVGVLFLIAAVLVWRLMLPKNGKPRSFVNTSLE